jgi:hypothetical protein
MDLDERVNGREEELEKRNQRENGAWLRENLSLGVV